MRLWIGNVARETSDEDLNAFLQRYGLPVCSDILRVEGDGSRDGVLVRFPDVELEALYQAAFRLDGLYWKGRAISVAVTLH